MKFAFYDLETTGISPAFDQPLQFAAILTDERFGEIERVEFRCRIAPHIIPSPHALAVTGVSPARLTDPSLPTLFEFMAEVAAVINRWAPAVWTGFNSIRFDEEVLRQGFYQNLQPDVYATQFNGNTRFDVLTALQAVWCRHPNFINWPVNENGHPRLKLDRIAPVMGFEGHNAHDALGDVEATIHVAREIATRLPEIWGELLQNRLKAHVKGRLEKFEPLALIERHGPEGPEATIGCFCGYSAENPNEAGFFDLGVADPTAYCGNADNYDISPMVERRSVGDPPEIAPPIIRPFAINKSPALLSVDRVDAETARRSRIIADTPKFRSRVARALADRFPSDPDTSKRPLERQIFDGFYSHADKALLSEFQRVDWRKRQEIASKLENVRLRRLGRRLVAFHAPELLSPTEQKQYRSWLREHWLAPKSPDTEWMTLEKANEAVEELRGRDTVEPGLLEEIVAFVGSYEARVPT